MSDVPWQLEPHTAAKHDIYRSYLLKWFPILLSQHGYPSVTYAEGFAGPGVYLDGEPGSPIIAIQALRETPELQESTKETRFLFIDRDPRCTTTLREQLVKRFPSHPRSPELMPVQIETGTCAEMLEPALEKLGAWHMPILAVLDSWGNAQVGYRLLRRLAQNPSSEVIVTLMPKHFMRFVRDLPPEADEVFGHNADWRHVQALSSGPEKKIFLLQQYRRMLGEAGFQYILDFELVTHKGESLYLIFGTNHRRGLEKMKESAWSVDARLGIGFRDPKDVMQESLFDLSDPELAPLERMLTERLNSGEPVRVEELREYALFKTVYREQHVIPALTRMRERGSISCDRSRIQRASLVRMADGARDKV